MRLSVALCTYNGALFLADQLGSIAAQDRLPDELVICDDRSTDETLAVLERFRATAPFPVRIFVNPRNLGSTSNFAQAIAQCRGESIVLADQDDVWLPSKLTQLEAALTANPDAGFVFTDAVMVDSSLVPIGYTLWDAICFHRHLREQVRQGQAFDLLLKRYFVTGATMAFRAQYRDLVLPIPKNWVHDAWIALLISAVAPCSFIEEPLIQYRQHSGQQIGERKRSLYEQYRVAKSMTQDTYRQVAENHQAVRERLASVVGFPVSPAKLAAIDGKVDHFRSRTRMRDPKVWRFPAVLREVLAKRYARYSLGWKSMVQDLFL